MSEPRIVIFDVETTGTDTKVDQIIELCVQFGLTDKAESRTWRMRPQVPIHPGAQKVHGISVEDLAECQSFSYYADMLRELFAEADMLVGYNLRFDIDMLQAEYVRLGQAPLDFSSKLIVDPFRLWQQSEPRSLMDAHKRFVGGDFDAAHSAAADVAATGRVLEGMIEGFGLVQDWEAIADVCEPERASWIEGSKHLRWDAEQHLMIGFGKHTGARLADMAAGFDAGYLEWIVKKDFPTHVIEACSKALELDAESLQDWAVKRFGSPPSLEDKPKAANPKAAKPKAAKVTKSTSKRSKAPASEKQEGTTEAQEASPRPHQQQSLF